MRCSHASVWESEVKLKIEGPLSQPYGCQLPFQGEPLENGKLWECRMQSAEPFHRKRSPFSSRNRNPFVCVADISPDRGISFQGRLQNCGEQSPDFYSLSQNRNPILTAPSRREPYAFLTEEGGPLAVEGVLTRPQSWAGKALLKGELDLTKSKTERYPSGTLRAGIS